MTLISGHCRGENGSCSLCDNPACTHDCHTPGARPRPKPCDTCPYRLDVPPGVWAASEYNKLPGYDRPMGMQPPGVFMCHQADGMVCAGWASVHGNDDSLALRLASVNATAPASQGINTRAVLAYTSPVPLFASGKDAAEHGLAGVENPPDDARDAVAKLTDLRERRSRRRRK